MTTTAGITLATAVITALDSSMCTWLTELPLGSLSVLPEVGRSRFATAAAEREPEITAVTRAMVTTGMAPKPPRLSGEAGSEARDQDGLFQVVVGWLGVGP
jgi:hypothetical protein